jgi:GGDEF domain-containing protein
LMACIAALDRHTLSVLWRRTALAVALLIVGYGVSQIVWLPHTWRLAGAVTGSLAATVVVLIAGALAWYNGDRYARWVIAAVILFALSAAVVARGHAEIARIDVFAFAMAVLLIVSSLMLRHVLISRERFGQAVLSRAKTNHLRDPLTALLSYEGFEREVENLNLRQTSEGGIAHLLYFSLTELNNFKHEDGYVVWQRDMVRFAAVLQRVLGEGWHIGRLSNSKFGAVRLSDQQTASSEPLLTLVLSHCARKIDTYGWVDRVGLRMAGVCAPLTSNGLKESLRLLDDSVQALEPSKRIALL